MSLVCDRQCGVALCVKLCQQGACRSGRVTVELAGVARAGYLPTHVGCVCGSSLEWQVVAGVARAGYLPTHVGCVCESSLEWQVQGSCWLNLCVTVGLAGVAVQGSC